MLRKLMVILFPVCILYFIFGAILLWNNILLLETYLGGAGIVGGVASVLGMLSFLRPALTRSDIQNIETDSLIKLAEVSSEIKKLEEERSKTATAINDLEKQKKEMDLLVRKASMVLLLKEQYSHHEKKIINFYNSNSDIQNSLIELSSLEKNLKH